MPDSKCALTICVRICLVFLGGGGEIADLEVGVSTCICQKVCSVCTWWISAYPYAWCWTQRQVKPLNCGLLPPLCGIIRRAVVSPDGGVCVLVLASNTEGEKEREFVCLCECTVAVSHTVWGLQYICAQHDKCVPLDSVSSLQPHSIWRPLYRACSVLRGMSERCGIQWFRVLLALYRVTHSLHFRTDLLFDFTQRGGRRFESGDAEWASGGQHVLIWEVCISIRFNQNVSRFILEIHPHCELCSVSSAEVIAVNSSVDMAAR